MFFILAVANLFLQLTAFISLLTQSVFQVKIINSIGKAYFLSDYFKKCQPNISADTWLAHLEISDGKSIFCSLKRAISDFKFRSAKMRKLATLKQFAFFNASRN
jgi:hypothetical protein